MAKVPDPGHKYADKRLIVLTKKLRRSYRQAALNLGEKITAYMERFEKEDVKMRALFDSGELSHEDYMAWRFRKIAGTKQWREMLDQLTTDLVNADRMAASMIRDELPEVYAENHNYGTYEIEHNLQMSTSYTLYNRDAVARLLKDNPDLLPQPRVDIPKDERWNRQHLQSAVMQGILTGESMKKIANRFRNVVGMDERAAIRNARTAVTGAENAGKLDSMRRAISLGVQLQKLWLATRDQRTRDSHVLLDGELREVDEKFSNGCMYPGDPHGAPGEVYNCRCAMRSKVNGADPYSPDLSRNHRLDGMSYDEWKRMHGERFYSKLFKNEPAQSTGKARVGNTTSILKQNTPKNSSNTSKTTEKVNLLGNTGKQFDSYTVRNAYCDSVETIDNTYDPKRDLEEQAREVFDQRNAYKIAARDAMEDQEKRRELDRLRPVKSFEEMVADKMSRKNMTREEALHDIIITATKTNEEVNKVYRK